MIKIQQRKLKWIILALGLFLIFGIGGAIFWWVNNNKVDPGQSSAGSCTCPSGYRLGSNGTTCWSETSPGATVSANCTNTGSTGNNNESPGGSCSPAGTNFSKNERCSSTCDHEVRVTYYCKGTPLSYQMGSEDSSRFDRDCNQHCSSGGGDNNTGNYLSDTAFCNSRGGQVESNGACNTAGGIGCVINGVHGCAYGDQANPVFLTSSGTKTSKSGNTVTCLQGPCSYHVHDGGSGATCPISVNNPTIRSINTGQSVTVGSCQQIDFDGGDGVCNSSGCGGNGGGDNNPPPVCPTNKYKILYAKCTVDNQILTPWVQNLTGVYGGDYVCAKVVDANGATVPVAEVNAAEINYKAPNGNYGGDANWDANPKLPVKIEGASFTAPGTWTAKITWDNCGNNESTWTLAGLSCPVNKYAILYAKTNSSGVPTTAWVRDLTDVHQGDYVSAKVVDASGNLVTDLNTVNANLIQYKSPNDTLFGGDDTWTANPKPTVQILPSVHVNFGTFGKRFAKITWDICGSNESSWTLVAATANACTTTPTIVNNGLNILVATASCTAGNPTYTWQKYINGVWTVVAANSGNTYPMINPMSGDYQVQVNCPASGIYTATSNACNVNYNQPQATAVNTCVTAVTLTPATGTVPGTTLTRNAATCKSGAAPVYTWTPSGPSSTATTTYTPTAAGTYTVTASCPAGVVNDINYSAGTCTASSTLVAPKYCWKCNPTTGLYELKGTNTACTTGQISTNTNTAPTTPACTQNPVCPATTVSVYSGDTATLGCLVGTPSSATVTPTCTSTQTVQYTCANGTSSVQCSYTCNPKPVNGVCATPSKQVTCGTAITPVCNSGTPSTTGSITVNSSGSYTCNGANGGSNATCSYSCTPAPVNGVCTTPSVQVTCGTSITPSCAKGGAPSIGTSSFVVNSNGSYTCPGTNGGTSATCNYACVKGNLSITKTVANKSGAQVASADFINNELYIANNGTVEFTVTVKNSGQAVMKSPIEVTDTYDSGLKYYSFYNGGSSLVTLASKDETTRTLVVLYGGDLAVGASFTYKVKMSVQTLGTYLKNNVYVKSPNQPGGTPCTAGATSSNETTCNDNSANAQVKVIPNPDLTITKRVLNNDHSAAVPANGSVQKTFEIEVRNIGKGAGTGKVIVNDKMDAGMTFVSASGTDWACTGTVGSQTFRCVYKNSETTPVTIPANGVNGSVLPKITVVVSVNVSTGVLFNTATVSNDIGTNCTGGTPHTDYLSPIEESSENNCSQDYVSPNFSPTAYTCGDLQSTPWTSNAAMQTYQKGSDVIFKVMLDGNNGIPKVVIKDATGTVIAELLNGVRSDQNTNGSYPLQSASYNFTWSDITADNGEYTAEVHIKVGSADYVKSTVNKCTLPFKVVSAEISVLKSSLVVCNDRDVLIQYDVAIVNDGNIDATGVDVVDTLDSKFQSSWLNSDMEPLGTLSNNSTLSWLDQSIKAGVTHHYTYNLSLPIAVARYGVATDEYPEFDNTVVVSGDFGTSVQDILKTTVTCQPPVVVDGRCSTTQNQCLAGTVQDITSSTWKCVGENGGATVTCTAPSSSSSSTTTSTCNPKNQNCSLPNTSNTDSGGNIWIIAIMLLIVSSIYGIRFSMKSKKNTSLFEKDM